MVEPLNLVEMSVVEEVGSESGAPETITKAKSCH